MSRIEQLFQKLGYSRTNGLFYSTEAETWIHLFPYRISKVLRDIIKPYAFYSLHHHGDVNTEHPEPINNPIILFFDKPNSETTKEIPKWSFCFGQAPVVIINTSDHLPLDIYHGYQFESDHSYLLKNINTDINTFSLINLTLGRTWKTLYQQHYKNVPKVDKYLLSNIVDARRILIANDGYRLNPKIANRLIGRLLFIRYLIDRRVVFKNQTYINGTEKSDRQISLNELIKDKNSLYNFFQYLTKKYEGDLFPLYETIFDNESGNTEVIYNEEAFVRQEHLEVLYHLFSGSSFFHTGENHKGYSVQPSLFMVYDFEVIPVELISNIYENFIGNEEENYDVKLANFKTSSKQFDIKAYYTPPFIVDYILSQTVAPFLDNTTGSSCKVLDPSCGSGIFLVETLRKIIEKEIKILNLTNQMLTNTQLWELLKENIFGIDIDEDAIEITIFSLYVTLLDYKTPIEIEEFKFEKLKGENLFGGPQFDFFNTSATFNTKFQEVLKLDFIIGNPPWGKVKASRYESYISTRNSLELSRQVNIDLNKIKITHPELPLEIGRKEISQAFLVRVSDFSYNPNMQIALVVSGKSLYNSESNSKKWREYFLSNFVLTQVMELSCVNNKIVGGNQIFEVAKHAPAILFYKLAKTSIEVSKNITTHITVRPNRFFNYFRTIVIEKHDIKQIRQQNFIPRLGGNDWLWKVMLHGNLLDYIFVSRLKKLPSIADFIEKHNLDTRGGLKLKDGNKKYSTESIKTYKYLDVELKKEFKPFRLTPSTTWDKYIKLKDEQANSNPDYFEGDVGYLPNTKFFSGERLLVKKGLQAAEGFKAVAAFTEENLIFTSTVCAIQPKSETPSPETTYLLKSLAGLINSSLFTYYIFNTSSSAGIDRTRMDFEEIFSSPAFYDEHFASIVDSIQEKYKRIDQADILSSDTSNINNEILQLKEEAENYISNYFKISPVERALIEYATEVAIPILKRSEETHYGTADIFRMLSSTNDVDKLYLVSYAMVFVNHFQYRFNTDEQYFSVNIYVADDFIGFHFIVGQRPLDRERIAFMSTNDDRLISDMGSLGIYNITRDLYIQQDVRGFSQNTFYIIKPNEIKCWHKAVAHHDLLEFIDALARAETL